MKNKGFKAVVSLVTLFAFVNLMVSCNYYKVYRSEDYKLDMTTNGVMYKYMIVHYNGEIVNLRNWTFNMEETEIEGQIGELDPQHEPTRKRIKTRPAFCIKEGMKE